MLFDSVLLCDVNIYAKQEFAMRATFSHVALKVPTIVDEFLEYSFEDAEVSVGWLKENDCLVS